MPPNFFQYDSSEDSSVDSSLDERKKTRKKRALVRLISAEFRWKPKKPQERCVERSNGN